MEKSLENQNGILKSDNDGAQKLRFQDFRGKSHKSRMIMLLSMLIISPVFIVLISFKVGLLDWVFLILPGDYLPIFYKENNIKPSLLVFITVVAVISILFILSFKLWREVGSNGRGLAILRDDKKLRQLKEGDFEGAVEILQGMSPAKRRAMPEILQEQVEALDRVFRLHARYSDAFACALADMPRTPGRPYSLRSLHQFLVNLLLAIGIVGTFYGLILFLQDPAFLELLKTFQRPQNSSSPGLSSITTSFQLAFGTSLLAYGANAAGRFLLDIADEDAEATWAAYQELLLLPFIHAFPVRGTVGTVEWDSRSLAAVEEVSKTLVIISHGLADMHAAQSKTIDVMKSHAEALQEAMLAVPGILNRMDDRAELLAARLDACAAGVERAAVRLDGAATRIGNAASNMEKQVSEAAGLIQAAIAALVNASRELSELLEKKLSTGVKTVSDAVEKATGHFQEVETGVKTVVKEMTGGVGALKTIIDQLLGAAVTLDESVRHAGGDMTAAVNAVSVSVGRALETDKNLRDALKRQIDQQVIELKNIRAALDTLQKLAHTEFERRAGGA